MPRRPSASDSTLDPLLLPLIGIESDARRDEVVGYLLTVHAEPVIRRSLQYRFRASRQDAMEDIRSAVLLRLIRKLDELRLGQVENIESFKSYVAMVTYHAVDDHLRRKQPERTLLANRLRYLLTHDARFALWQADRDLACGLAAWNGRAPQLPAIQSQHQLDAFKPAESLLTLFRAVNHPLTFQDAVGLFADAAGLNEPVHAMKLTELVEPAPSALQQAESRQLLGKLWAEIDDLPRRQRIALLLSLRDQNGVSAVPLLPLTGIATMNAIAGSLGMPLDDLVGLWDDLPLDDNRIAAYLNLTRQQVINLRKSARHRLARRMARG